MKLFYRYMFDDYGFIYPFYVILWTFVSTGFLGVCHHIFIDYEWRYETKTKVKIGGSFAAWILLGFYFAFCIAPFQNVASHGTDKQKETIQNCLESSDMDGNKFLPDDEFTINELMSSCKDNAGK